MSVPQVQEVLKGLAFGERRFIYGLECVPDDRLNWSPGGAAKTPLQLAGKTADFLGFFSTLLETRKRPDFGGSWPPPPQTRAEANAKLEAAFARLRAVVTALSEVDLSQIVPAPWGEATIGQAIGWINGVLSYHQGQLNYVQMAYGDEDPNMPPEWGHA
jgi:DinB superfamily